MKKKKKYKELQHNKIFVGHFVLVLFKNLNIILEFMIIILRDLICITKMQ